MAFIIPIPELSSEKLTVFYLQVFAIVVLILLIAVFYTLEAPVLWSAAARLGLQLAFALAAFCTFAGLLTAT